MDEEIVFSAAPDLKEFRKSVAAKAPREKQSHEM
jgi:hypothetical protein